jgi:hypothetical protein
MGERDPSLTLRALICYVPAEVSSTSFRERPNYVPGILFPPSIEGGNR